MKPGKLGSPGRLRSPVSVISKDSLAQIEVERLRDTFFIRHITGAFLSFTPVPLALQIKGDEE